MAGGPTIAEESGTLVQISVTDELELGVAKCGAHGIREVEVEDIGIVDTALCIFAICSRNVASSHCISCNKFLLIDGAFSHCLAHYGIFLLVAVLNAPRANRDQWIWASASE